MEVSYIRSGVSRALLATAGRSEFDQTDQEGTHYALITVDWIFNAADLIAAGIQRPAAGDQVRVTRNGATETFEVLSRLGMQTYRLDPQGKRIRVHTLRIEKVTT